MTIYGKDHKEHPLRLEVENRIKEKGVGFDEAMKRYIMEFLAINRHKDEEINLLKIENRKLKDKLDSLTSKLRVHMMDQSLTVHKVDLE